MLNPLSDNLSSATASNVYLFYSTHISSLTTIIPYVTS